MSADQSSIEIKTALRKLNPKNGGDHKYRVRRLNKFRNYVTAERSNLPHTDNDTTPHNLDSQTNQNQTNSGSNTPEFYDDDLIMLFTGTNSMNGVDMGYSLLQAAGEPSTDHNSVLKRSAKNAMALMKFLVCDFVDVEHGKPVQLSNDLNSFAHAFCSLTVMQLQPCQLESHLLDTPNGDTKRSGSKQDACELVLMLLLHHTNSDGTSDEPLSLEVLVPNAQSRNSFFSWMQSSKPGNEMEKMKKRMVLANDTEQMAALSSLHDPSKNISNDHSDSHSQPTTPKTNTLSHSAFSKSSSSGPPVRWADSQMAKFIPPSKTTTYHHPPSMTIPGNTITSKDNPNREQLQAAVEKTRAVEERQKHNGRDPLGLRGEEFDLQLVQANRETLIQEALELFQEEEEEELQYLKSTTPKEVPKETSEDHHSHPKSANDANNAMAQERLLNLHMRRDAFLDMIETSGDRKRHDATRTMKEERKDPENDAGEEQEEQDEPTENDTIGSILPFDPDFDPMLFLTLVHGRATYDQLEHALQKLNNTADTQTQRLQNIVRDNFGLFVRCADGIDFFSDEADNASQISGDDTYDDDGNSIVTKSITRALAPDQLDKLEGLADRCSLQAKKSFKPLLDNTNEVRKTQRALALLHRVSPLLQVPHQMRQHMDAGNYAHAIKAYRRILVIDKECQIDLLQFVKTKADEASRETRRIVEKTIADATVSVTALLEAIQDLGELEELQVSFSREAYEDESGKRKKKNVSEEEQMEQDILRHNPPALACLQLQASHFSSIVEQIIEHSETITTRIYNGDSSALQEDYYLPSMMTSKSDHDSLISDFTSNTSDSRRKNKWRYDILEARVKATVQGVIIARKWLTRLMRIGVVAMGVERRHAARLGQRKVDKRYPSMKPPQVFAQIAPAIHALVSHVNFCSLGCSNTSKSSDPKVKMSFGEEAPQALQILLKTPLPPHESSRCALELADLVELVRECSTTANSFNSPKFEGGVHVPHPNSRPTKPDSKNPDRALLEKCVQEVEEAVITMERRQCIYAFHVCTRNCGRRASGAGVFDGEAISSCVHALSKVLSRPEACTIEIEKGCHLVAIKCCEGLVEYVRDKQGSGAGSSNSGGGSGAGSSGAGVRLRAVSECAKMLSKGIENVIREVSALTKMEADSILEVMEVEVLKLEEKLFQGYLEDVKKDVTSCIKLGYLDFAIANAVDEEAEDDIVFDQKPVYAGNTSFPGYLSASLLAIVRCRARVQKSIGETTLRKSQNESYLQIAMSLASNTLIDALCKAIHERAERILGKQADMMANELQFLVNTLNKDLNEEVRQSAEECRRMLFSKSGRGGKGLHGEGPDGLAAIEELERLGRVYVMCLGIDE